VRKPIRRFVDAYDLIGAKKRNSDAATPSTAIDDVWFLTLRTGPNLSDPLMLPRHHILSILYGHLGSQVSAISSLDLLGTIEIGSRIRNLQTVFQALGPILFLQAFRFAGGILDRKQDAVSGTRLVQIQADSS
jgi:hypothetical protein